MRPMRRDTAPPAGRLARAWRRLRRWRYQETDTRRYDQDQGCLVQRGLWRVGDTYYAYDYDDIEGVRRMADVPGGLLREVDPLSGNVVRGGRIIACGYASTATAACAAWRTSSRSRAAVTPTPSRADRPRRR